MAHIYEDGSNFFDEGRDLEARGDYEAAGGRYRVAIRTEGSDSHWLDLAVVTAASGDTFHALCALRAAVRHGSEDTRLAGALKQICDEVAVGPGSSLRSKNGMSSCEDTVASLLSLLKGDRDNKARAMRQYAALGNLTTDKRRLVANALCEAGFPEQALQEWSAVVKDAPNDSDALFAIANIHYDLGQLDHAHAIYKRVIALDPKHGLARSGCANVEKDWGNLDQALKFYQQALDCDRSDPTFVFNLAQCHEYLCDYDSAISVIDVHRNDLKASEMTTVNHFAVPLLLTKLLFASANPRFLSTVREVLAFPAAAVSAVKRLHTHWAYFFFLSRLCQQDLCAPTPEQRPLYFVGDSHCLSTAWLSFPLIGEDRVMVPRLVTGLKAWHMRAGNKFLTTANLDRCFASLPLSTREIVFVAGEIDCREGIATAVDKGRYSSDEEAVQSTMALYVTALQAASARYNIRMLLHPITPPTNPTYTRRAEITRRCTHVLSELLPDAIEDVDAPVARLNFFQQLVDKDGFMRAEYNCDGTHLSREYAPLLFSSLQNAKRK